LTERIVFETGKEEQFVLFDRAADVPPKTVPVESWVREDALRLEGLVFGIEITVLKVLIELAMELIAAALHDRVELAARRMPELGLKLVLEQRKFSDGFAGHRGIRPGYVFSVVIDTLDRKIIVPRSLTADRRAGADADAAGARDADLQERRVDHAHADRIRWQVGDLPARIVRLDLRGRSVNDHRPPH
jgi:hypothetical protein